MASNYTPNFNLCQWEAEDQVLRTDFNTDNARIDAALAAKADKSALNSLQGTVNSLSTGKADQSALDALKTTVNQQGATLAGKGNCQIYAVRHTGTGSYGESSPTSLTFPSVPELVLIARGGQTLILIPGETVTWTIGSSGGVGMVTVSWSGKTVRWYSTNVKAQMNERSVSYPVIALMKAD